MTNFDAWRQRANAVVTSGQTAIGRASERVVRSIRRRSETATSSVAEAYNAALDWKGNAELSRWLTEHLSHQVSTAASRAMDAEYLRTRIGGGWHRVVDGGHSLAGSWNAVREALPDSSALEQIATWTNEYWKDFVTTRGMPIITLDSVDDVSEYLKHLDVVNAAQLAGGELVGVSIYCNWNNPAKLIASTASADCSGIVYANVVAPLVGLIALGRAFYLLRQAEQDDLRQVLAPALKGLTRGGATILLVTVVPGGFLLHLSCGIVINLVHGYVWDKGSENKEMIFDALKRSVLDLRSVQPKLEGPTVIASASRFE